MALLWGVMLVLVFAVVQVAIYFYASQLAATAAQEGVRTGRPLTVVGGPQAIATARDAAEEFLARADGTALTDLAVDAVVTQPEGLLSVQVTGHVLSLLPGVDLQVTRDAAGALERIT